MSIAFISSRIWELEAERETAKETLYSLGFKEVIVWEELPGRPSPPRKSFLKEVDRSKIFILILWKEYSEAAVREYKRAKSRQIPILVFIKKPQREEKLDPKLREFVDTEISQSLSWKEFEKLSEFRESLKKAVNDLLFEHLEIPFLSHSRKDLYELGEDIAASAKRRIVLMARSLILVTGPRPYASDSPIGYEKSHYDCLLEIARNAKEGKIKFSCGYVVPYIRKELLDHPKVRSFARENLSKLVNDSCKKVPQSLFILATPPPTWDPFFTFIVGDNRFAIWFKDPADPEIYACISSDDQTIANALVHIFESVCRQKSLEPLLKELQLSP